MVVTKAFHFKMDFNFKTKALITNQRFYEIFKEAQKSAVAGPVQAA